MSIVAQKKAKRDIKTELKQEKNVISAFFSQIGLAALSRKVNACRQSKYNLSWLLHQLLDCCFSRLSLFRASKNKLDKATHARTVRHLLNDGRINWQKLLCLTAQKLSKNKAKQSVFIVDDTLIARSGAKQTELLAKTYDHDKHHYLPGYRGLTLGWDNGQSFLPVDFALMSSHQPKDRIGQVPLTLNQNSNAGRRRLQATKKMNDVAIELVKQALAAGLNSKYVLFDTWFAQPKMFWQLKQLGLNSICMLKQTPKSTYWLNKHKYHNIKIVYQHLKKYQPAHGQDYFYSAIVQARYQNIIFL